MGSISIPTMVLISAIGTGLSAGMAAYESHEQGVAASNQAKQKARVEAMNETQKQINMRQTMLKALSTQNAGTLGAVGTGASTSFGANAMRQITQNQNDMLISRANSSAQVSLLDQQAANARSAGDMGAVGDIFSAAPKVVGGVNTFMAGK